MLTQVVEASLLLLEDDSAHGKILMVHVNGKFYEWTPPKGNLKLQSSPDSTEGSRPASVHHLPVHHLPMHHLPADQDKHCQATCWQTHE